MLSSEYIVVLSVQHTHEPNVHQLIVKVDGWKQVQPVSVDKVGVYFRNAAADIDSTSKMVCIFWYVVFAHYFTMSGTNFYYSALYSNHTSMTTFVIKYIAVEI